jgi:hypothetical protein
MLTLQELKEKIVEQVDEVDFVDLLGLTTEDLLEAFSDKVEENINKFIEILELPNEDMEDEINGNE